jgi:erythromycin esterase-like protein
MTSLLNLLDLLDLLAVPPTLLAFGEPTHGESAFLQIRNEAFASLAERGYRSIALESDQAAGLIADEFVRGSTAVTLDRALAEGFSHEFGVAPANRDLLLWMREWNAGRPASERLTFHGFDAPLDPRAGGRRSCRRGPRSRCCATTPRPPHRTRRRNASPAWPGSATR